MEPRTLDTESLLPLKFKERHENMGGLYVYRQQTSCCILIGGKGRKDVKDVCVDKIQKLRFPRQCVCHMQTKPN